MISMRALLVSDPLLPPETRRAIAAEGAEACGALGALGLDPCDASELLDQPGVCCYASTVALRARGSDG